MFGMKETVLVLVFVCTPLLAHGQVVISEFLYDAPGSDDNQEWLEVFNAGSTPVDLSKWKVNDGSNHILNAPPKNGGTGSLTLPPGGYLVLADDATAFIAAHPSPACAVIDTTLSLGNTSGTVSLIDDTGATADSLPYSKDQGGAGDGNTLARASVSEKTVSAGAPSPCTGTLSASPADTTSTGTEDATQEPAAPPAQSQSTSASVSSYVVAPVPVLFADGGEDRTVIVGADVVLSGRAYLRSKDIVEKVRHSWNFGDGNVAEGAHVMHHWEYPGRYAVVLTVAQATDSASDRIIIVAEPAKLSFTTLTDGGVEIGNSAGRDLDLSRWIVHGTGQSFTLPPESFLLSGASLRISAKTLGFRADTATELQYPNGLRALSAGQSSVDTPPSAPVSAIPVAAITNPLTPAPAPESAAPIPPPRSTRTSRADVSSSETPADPIDATYDPVPQDAASTSAQTAVAISAFSTIPVRSPWLWGTIGLATFGGAAGFLVKRAKKEEWKIEEDGEAE
ncbi:lamin tail domain-containing protein [Candidatus Kaiserbacteria bacterium]|nr:lamin tail domain-containing protein [Candidatus Kaiserbacteria bacterium]